MMEWVEFTAKTVSDAVTEASIKFEVTSDMLEYEVIEVEKSGFLGLFSKPAKIRARKKSAEAVIELDKKEEVKKTPVKKENKFSTENKLSTESKLTKENKPVKENKVSKGYSMENKVFEEKFIKKEEEKVEEAVKKPVNAAEIEAVAKKFLADVFAAMDIKAELNAHYNQEEDIVEINMEGEDMGILIGKRGQTLDSLQYLVSLVINKESNSYLKVKLDTENYRERRKETLENLAKNISYKVKRTKRPVSLEPMNPYERRIIHSALQGDKFVETHSEGDEPYRRVVVTLKKGYREYSNRGNGRNYNRNHNYNKRNYEKRNTASSEVKAVETKTEE